jgi:hypothetical protein
MDCPVFWHEALSIFNFGMYYLKGTPHIYYLIYHVNRFDKRKFIKNN